MTERLARLPRAVAESQGYRVLDGVEETLRALSEQGYLLGLTTGGVEAAAHIKLARAGLNHYFRFGGFGSDSTDRAELTRCAITRAGRALGQRLDAQRILVVGDTPKDIDAARGVGGGRGRCCERPLQRGGAPRVGRGLRARVASGVASGPRRGDGR